MCESHSILVRLLGYEVVLHTTGYFMNNVPVLFSGLPSPPTSYNLGRLIVLCPVLDRAIGTEAHQVDDISPSTAMIVGCGLSYVLARVYHSGLSHWENVAISIQYLQKSRPNSS